MSLLGWDQSCDRLVVVRNDDFIAGLKIVNQLREFGLRFLNCQRTH